MKKKFLCGILSATVLIISAAIPVMAENNASVQINGSPVTFTEQDPIILNGRVMVPIRAIFEKMGFTVSWNEQTKTAFVSGLNVRPLIDSVSFSQDSSNFYLNSTITNNGTPITMDVATQNINGCLCVPLRYAAYSVGYDVYWNDNEKIAYIERLPLQVSGTYPHSSIPVCTVSSIKRAYTLPRGKRVYVHNAPLVASQIDSYFSTLAVNGWSLINQGDDNRTYMKNSEFFTVFYGSTGIEIRIGDDMV